MVESGELRVESLESMRLMAALEAESLTCVLAVVAIVLLSFGCYRQKRLSFPGSPKLNRPQKETCGKRQPYIVGTICAEVYYNKNSPMGIRLLTRSLLSFGTAKLRNDSELCKCFLEIIFA